MKRMASLQILLSVLLLLHLDETVKSRDSQPSVKVQTVKTTFLPATVGQNVTLQCSYKNEISGKLYWYKQNLENTLRMTSSYFDKSEFYTDFHNNDRFKLDNKDKKNNLEITNVKISDSAVYHCIRCVGHFMDFLATVYVTVKNFHSGFQIDQMALETVKPGRSLVLNCKVKFGTCAGQYRVHWFKQSEESAAGVLYSHGGSSDQCDNNTNTSTNSCVYSLPIHNVSSEQTGTYYCAVDACGQVLFGNGTSVNMKTTVDPVFYILTGALAFTSVLVVLLGFSLYIVMKKNKRQNTE
ncbi:hypothetical protein NL108_017225 [Boleophthalmus pectinirostris]|uniref:uncharacterized protein LOC110168901 isoform X2 n=1 Tax=Boleophthalmus pectinirostris TaxID=150288 RepID=UPI00242C1C45|nr:uncharacterized protein LOC110168901 isoform X2 [Boleophthalmus pectinirostris]KAJ0055994.1 hypothetical protein NL108_017225 [Boleophthalmus pectinirostris]